jgi:GTP-binding protein HflX
MEYGLRVLLSDTVGFIRDLPHHLVASFKATLEEAVHSDLMLHVVDASASDAEDEIRAVQEVLGEIGCAGKAQMIVMNKQDISPAAWLDMLMRKYPDSVATSATTGEGLDGLQDAVLNRLAGERIWARLRASVAYGRLLAWLDNHAEVLHTRYDGDKVLLDICAPMAILENMQIRFGNVKILARSKTPPAS